MIGIKERVEERLEADKPEQEEDRQQPKGPEHNEQDLNDMLQEMRILQQGVQVLTAFLIILPFMEGFDRIDPIEKWIYLITFVCSVSSLVLLSGPAAQHRLARPLMDRQRFKDFGTRMVIIGLVPFSIALVLSTQLVVSQVIGNLESVVVAALVALLIGAIWWVIPLAHKEREQR